VVCGIIVALSALFILLLVIPGSAKLSSRTLLFQSLALLSCCIWVFSAVVPFDVYVAQHQASVTAYTGGVQVPQIIVQQVQNALGLTSEYRHISYRTFIHSVAMSCDGYYLFNFENLMDSPTGGDFALVHVAICRRRYNDIVPCLSSL
jgi:hypothetical protein